MASAVPEADGVTRELALVDAGRIEVGWLGARPAWLADPATTTLHRFSVMPQPSATTQVIHLPRNAPTSVEEIRRAQPNAAVVVDVGSASTASDAILLDASAADVVLVESEGDLRVANARVGALEGKLIVCPAALDLESNAPESVLTKVVGAHIKRFRRLHRLAHPTFLFVGPYVPAGGLGIAIAAAYRLRQQFENVRLAAIPLGAVEKRYLDSCEMEALGLGHRGIIEWTCPPDERRFWYATATVVCCPWSEAGAATDAPLLAAAAGRPFVGSDVSSFRDAFRPSNALPFVRPNDVDALVEALAPLLADAEAATEIGTQARLELEAQYSNDAAAGRLASIWGELADRPDRTPT